MLFPPCAYIIGAQKAGTSSLATLLAQHPAINLARGKEVHFFSTNWDKGLEWYAAQFSPKSGAEILLDASPSYSSAPLGPFTPKGYAFRVDRLKVAERIAELRPDARLIYVLRDPVERVYSAYWQAMRSGYEMRPLDVAIRENPEYVYASLYFEQLQHILCSFRRESILLVSFKDFQRDAAVVARECLIFLGARPFDFEFTDVRPRNVGFRYNALGIALRNLAGSERSLGTFSAAARRILPRRAYNSISRLVSRPVEEMDAMTHAAIEPYVKEDYRRFVEFTGISLA